jgi:signal transduction histidine kinase
MRSIRFTLVVYFLLLLAAALGAVCGLVYRTADQSLLAKEESTRALLRAQHEARCRVFGEQFDADLLRRARTLANLAQSQGGGHRHRDMYLFSLVATGAGAWGGLLLPLWLERPIYSHFQRSLAQIQFAEDVMTREEEGRETDFFQIYNEGGVPLQRSRSLGDRSLTLDSGVRESLGLLEWRFDDAEPAPGLPVRRVTLKAPVSRFRVPLNPRPLRRGPVAEARAAVPASPRFTDRPLPAVFIQFAAATHSRDAALAVFARDLDQHLADLEEVSAATLAGLRQRLLWISLATFAASVAGGYWLIGVGLAPLRRLSDAVSRVSEKDFRLRFEARGLPRELRPILDRLTQTLEMLRRAFAREKQAAADISHELRTPLAALLTTLEVALRKPRAPEQYDGLLRDCRAIGEQMSGLVERLLALARLDAGADAVRPREVDAAELAEQCVALVRPLADTRGLGLGLACAGPVYLTTDPDKLREVLTNLLHNAIEYNRPGGQVEVSLARNNGSLCLEVRDTGIGIPAQAQDQVFERFYRADGSRQADGLHAGLGLAIVRGYVQLLGGTVSVDSAVGQGSTFRVLLPAH